MFEIKCQVKSSGGIALTSEDINPINVVLLFAQTIACARNAFEFRPKFSICHKHHDYLTWIVKWKKIISDMFFSLHHCKLMMLSTRKWNCNFNGILRMPWFSQTKFSLRFLDSLSNPFDNIRESCWINSRAKRVHDIIITRQLHYCSGFKN